MSCLTSRFPASLARPAGLALAILALAPSVAPAQSQPPRSRPWYERITFSGDFRGRYEGFFQEDRDNRHRERFRLRVGLTTDIADDLRFGLRLASGDIDDLVSSNQSLTDLLRRKAINLDLVYLTYTPAGAKGLRIGGGKYAYPVTRTQMVWDDDLNWEGTFGEYSGRAGARVTYKIVGVQSPIREVGSGQDSFLFAGYGQVGVTAGRHTIEVSIADYSFTEEDQIALGVDEGLISTSLTNAVVRNAAGRITGFANDFNLVDVIARATLATAKPQYPVTLLVDWVTNTQATGDDGTGVWAVVGYGEASEPGTFAAEYTFSRIEREAVLSTFNFSDIPATNVRMHMVNFSVMPKARLNLEARGIFTRRLDVGAGQTNHLLKRVQIDARVRF
jgi:hypothetical protein